MLYKKVKMFSARDVKEFESMPGMIFKRLIKMFQANFL